jgi:hypothetical protein
LAVIYLPKKRKGLLRPYFAFCKPSAVFLRLPRFPGMQKHSGGLVQVFAVWISGRLQRSSSRLFKAALRLLSSSRLVPSVKKKPACICASDRLKLL